MGRLRRADLLGALAIVGVAMASPSLDAFPLRVLPLLRDLLGAEVASYTEVDEDRLRRLVAASPWPRGPADIPSKWTFAPFDTALPPAIGDLSLAAEHPVVSYFARTGDGRALRVSDFLSLGEFQRTEMYQQVFRPIGARYQLAAALATPGPMPAGVGFMRTQRDFGEREKDLLDLLRPHLVAARESVQTRASAEDRIAALERGLEAQGRGVVTLHGDRFEALSREGERLVRRWFPDGVPTIVDARPLVLEDACVRLTVRRADGDPPLLLLDETRLAPEPSRARELGLTVRESEVLGLAARGMSYVQIAETLVVSVRTVEKHLEHAYRKLGVSGRREAVARVLGRPPS